MKNKLIPKLLLFLFFCSGFSLSQAQTSVQITTAGDTTWFGAYCGTPDTINFYLNGNCTGYNTLTDSMDVFINFGDFYGLNKRWRIFFLIDSILFYTNKYSVYNLVFDRI